VNVTTLAESLLAWMAAEGQALTDDLNQLEPLVRDAVHRVGARALELQVARGKLGYEGAARPCGCGQLQRFLGHRPKTIETLLGTIRLARAYYRCSSCRQADLPYDQRVGLCRSPVSQTLAEAVTHLAIQEPFAHAAESLHKLTGRRLSESTVTRLTRRVGGVAARQEQALAGRMETWQSPRAEVTPERLYGAADGTMIHLQDGWHEAKTAAFYWDAPGGLKPVRYCVRLEAVDQFKGHFWALGCRCGLEQARQKALLGDGALWIWQHLGGLMKEATHIVDWFHACEHLWSCARELHGPGTPQARGWEQEHQALLKDGNVRGLLECLRQQHARARSAAKRKALQGLITYITHQDDRLAYDRFKAQGFDIGSGRVEAACKSAVGVRMKRNGARWSAATAQATLSLRVAWLNRDWDAFWKTHPLANAA